MPFITTLFLSAAAVTAGTAPSLSPAAVEFIAQGAPAALGACDLPARKCNGNRLTVKSIDSGESNNEKKSFETLAASGMEAMVIFSAANRSKYSLENVEISNAKWPAFSGIAVGAARDAVIQALGLPNNGTSNACDSYVDDEHRSEAIICYRAGQVTRLRWQYFAD